jgi:hypothetical protein
LKKARFLFVLETVFDTVNQETDKIEQKRRAKFKQNNIYDDEKTSDLILQGQLKKNTGTFGFSWQIRYTKLYPNRLELHYEKGDKDPEVKYRRSETFFRKTFSRSHLSFSRYSKKKISMLILLLFKGLHDGAN